MKHLKFKRSLFTIACIIFILQSIPSYAQGRYETQAIMNRIKQVETQINTLNRAVYRGETPLVIEGVKDKQSSGISAAGIASFENRVSQLEQSQRILTGQLEKVLFEIRKLNDSFKLMQADTEQRFKKTKYMPEEKYISQSSKSKPSSGHDEIVFFNKEKKKSLDSEAKFQQNILGTISSSDGHRGIAESLYEKAFSSIKEANYDVAEKEFKLFLKKFPRHPLAPNSQYWLGETYYVRGDYKEAAKIFAQGYQNFPKSSKSQDSLLKLALSLARMGRVEDACLSLNQLQKEFTENSSLQQRSSEEMQRLSCN